METVWFAEAPKFPGYYLAEVPQRTGKLGDGVELGTYSPHGARRFESEAAVRDYIAEHPHPAWIPTEHVFVTPLDRGVEA